MTGAQFPLYVILHVIVMTSFSCTAPEVDKFVVQLVFPPTFKTPFLSGKCCAIVVDVSLPLRRLCFHLSVCLSVSVLFINRITKQNKLCGRPCPHPLQVDL